MVYEVTNHRPYVMPITNYYCHVLIGIFTI